MITILIFFPQQLTSIKEQTIAQIQGFLPDLTQAQQDAIVSSIETMIETEIQIIISGQGTEQIISGSGGSLGGLRPVSTNIETNFQSSSTGGSCREVQDNECSVSLETKCQESIGEKCTPQKVEQCDTVEVNISLFIKEAIFYCKIVLH